VVDGARRSRLVHVDALATTWEAWDVQDGTRLLVRCIRPRWRDDPVMLRRMARGARGPRPPEWRDGEWPHLRATLSGTPLRDRLPVEDTPSTTFLARVLGKGLDALRRFHESGLVHGGPILDTLIENDDGGLTLVYLDPFPARTSESDDLRELARAVTALDPTGEDPVTRMADAWSESPPPSARRRSAPARESAGRRSPRDPAPVVARAPSHRATSARGPTVARDELALDLDPSAALGPGWCAPDRAACSW
jgi:hypothetical protein